MTSRREVLLSLPAFGMAALLAPAAYSAPTVASGANTGMLNAKEAGALGNGTTDDTEALAAALATGRSVFLPAGNYLISRTLSFARDGQCLVGEGKGG